MSTTDEQILSIAEVISDMGDSEVHRRASISRSYYAAYHRANKYHSQLKTPGQKPASGGVHEKLIGQLNNPTVQNLKVAATSREVGQLLHTLKRARTRADYKLKEKVTRSDVIGTMVGARKILALI